MDDNFRPERIARIDSLTFCAIYFNIIFFIVLFLYELHVTIYIFLFDDKL